jgi:biotin carboxyl carrier protein
VTVDLKVGGRRFRAVVTPSRAPDGSARLRVVLQALDGEAFVEERQFDVCQTGAGLSLLQVPDGRVIDATVAPVAADHLLVQLAGVDLDVHVNGRRSTAADGASGAEGEQRVCAPMPGRVLRVLVDVGAAVVFGQPLVVIEAMKMENALTAVRDGVVQDVSVVEGTSVEAGRLLLRIV